MLDKAEFRFPRFDQRTVILGSTGSGKTQAAVWLLSVRWNPGRIGIIFDFKGDQLLDQIGATEISIMGGVPKKPGLYIVRPVPELHDEEVKAFLWKIWAQGECIVYIDEGFMLGNRNPGLNVLLTQGRSKHIEMIILSQRPSWMSRFVWSEASIFMVMRLNDEEDKRTVSRFIGGQSIRRLPRFHSLWYDTERQATMTLEPVPNRAELIQRFDRLLSKRRKSL